MKKTILFSLLFVFSCQFMSHAQWLEKKGDGYFKLGAWSLVADQHYTRCVTNCDDGPWFKAAMAFAHAIFN